MFYILLDENNDSKYLNIKDIDTNNTFKFKNFCQFFFTLCLFIKEKNFLVLKQYSYLLNKQKDNNSFDNILKIGQKEGIIRFILSLKVENNYKNKEIYPNNYNLDIKNKVKDISTIKKDFNLNKEENDFIKQIFDSYSSHFDKNFNYLLSYWDIINFLRDFNLIRKNNNYDNLLIEKISLARNNSKIIFQN